jgi:hypothetical protein
MRVRRAHGIAVDAFSSDLLAAATLNGVIDAQGDHPSGDEHRHQEPEQQPTGFERRPDSAIQDPMIALKSEAALRPIIWRIAVTVRFPGARTAPVGRTFTCCQTGLEKTGAKIPMTLEKVIGKESMAILSG